MIWNFWKCPILFFYLYHYGNNSSYWVRLLYKYQYYFTKQEITDSYYDKSTSDGKFATITTVDGKVDKTSIAAAISSTPSVDKVASEKAVYDKNTINHKTIQSVDI